MVGILVQLVISFILLYWYCHGGLAPLGLWPTARRLRMFIFFLLLSAFCAASRYIVRLHFGKEVWELNPALSSRLVWDGIWWNMKSVLYEELIFRGALFYILWDKLGATKAIVISAVAFGIYHWFTYELWGQPIQMTIIFIVTGLAGLVYGYAYVRTKSMLVPIAMHFGWNFIGNFAFSEGQIGKGILVMKEQPIVNVSIFIYYLAMWNPMVMFLGFNYLILRMISKRDI